MISKQEKIEIIQKRINNFVYLITLIYDYIDKVQNGMEDPGITINRALSLIQEIQEKVNKLEEEKLVLTNQIYMI